MADHRAAADGPVGPDTAYARAKHYVLGCGCLILCLIVAVVLACVVNDLERSSP